MKTRFFGLMGTVVLALALLFVGLAQFGGAPASAEPEIVGNPEGAVTRALIRENETVKRIVYVAGGTKTMANTTPVTSDAFCGNFGTLHRADVVLNGGMAGTNPTLTILWQNSIDGVTWNNVGTWTQINATVTPQSQSQAVGEVQATAANVYGDCWRVQYTFGGTGTVTADFKIIGVEK